MGHTSYKITSSYCTLHHCPGWHFVYKYMKIVRSASLSWATLLRQIHQNITQYITALGHTSVTCTSPYSTPLPWDTLCLHIHNPTALYVTALGHTCSISIWPYYTLRHCHGSHLFYKYIPILHSPSMLWIALLLVHHHILPWVTLLLQVLYTALHVLVMGHVSSTST